MADGVAQDVGTLVPGVVGEVVVDGVSERSGEAASVAGEGGVCGGDVVFVVGVDVEDDVVDDADGGSDVGVVGGGVVMVGFPSGG